MMANAPEHLVQQLLGSSSPGRWRVSATQASDVMSMTTENATAHKSVEVDVKGENASRNGIYRRSWRTSGE